MDKETRDVLASIGINADHLNRKIRIIRNRAKGSVEEEIKPVAVPTPKGKHKYSRNDD